MPRQDGRSHQIFPLLGCQLGMPIFKLGLLSRYASSLRSLPYPRCNEAHAIYNALGGEVEEQRGEERIDPDFFHVCIMCAYHHVCGSSNSLCILQLASNFQHDVAQGCWHSATRFPVALDAAVGAGCGGSGS